MKRVLIIISVALIAFILACNILVVGISQGHCYDSVADVPSANFGILLGTGRSAEPSPYYDARLQATIDSSNKQSPMVFSIIDNIEYRDTSVVAYYDGHCWVVDEYEKSQFSATTQTENMLLYDSLYA